MQARITIIGNTAHGHTITVYLPKGWLNQFGINSPSLLGETLGKVWGTEEELSDYRHRSVNLGIQTGESHLEKTRTQIEQAKEYLRNIKHVDKEILIGL